MTRRRPNDCYVSVGAGGGPIAWREELCGISGLSDSPTDNVCPEILRTITPGILLVVLPACNTSCAAG